MSNRPDTPERPDTPPTPKPSTGSNANKWVIGVIVGAVVIIALANTKSGSGGGTGGNSHTVTYKVTGGHGASVTYENSSNDTSQDTSAATPWSTVVTLSSGDFYYVSAQNQGGGTITCSVLVDGSVVDTNSSSGAYAICSASGSV